MSELKNTLHRGLGVILLVVGLVMYVFPLGFMNFVGLPLLEGTMMGMFKMLGATFALVGMMNMHRGGWFLQWGDLWHAAWAVMMGFVFLQLGTQLVGFALVLWALFLVVMLFMERPWEVQSRDTMARQH